jgi:uncharacterized membrane protein YczE
LIDKIINRLSFVATLISFAVAVYLASKITATDSLDVSISTVIKWRVSIYEARAGRVAQCPRAKTATKA